MEVFIFEKYLEIPNCHLTAGKILPDYRRMIALANGAYVISKSDITTGCIAAGLFFSLLIVEAVQGLIRGEIIQQGKEFEKVEVKLSGPTKLIEKVLEQTNTRTFSLRV